MSNVQRRSEILLILLLLHNLTIYAFESERSCLNLKEGTTAEFACPCRTGVGSFSKTNEKGTIWSNGIVAKDKRGRISYQNGKVLIRNVVPYDEGEFIWVCDETYWQESVCLTIDARLGNLKINAQPSIDLTAGEKLTLSVASNSSSRMSFVSCRFSPSQNCSDISYSRVLYDSRYPVNPRARGPQVQFHVVKRSAVDFDIVFDMVSNDNTGCYVCQESHVKRKSSDAKKAEVVIRVHTRGWQLSSLATAFASILLVLFLIALCCLCTCRISRQLKLKGSGRYQTVADEDKLESLYVISIASSLKPTGKIQQPDLVESAVSHNQQRALEDHLIAMLNRDITPTHKSEQDEEPNDISRCRQLS